MALTAAWTKARGSTISENISGFVRQVHHTDNWTVVYLEHMCGTRNLNVQAFAGFHTANIRMAAV